LKVTEAPYIAISEIAALIRVSEARVYQLIAERAIPAVRTGRRIRVPRAAFDAFLRSQEQRALANLREPVGVAQEIFAANAGLSPEAVDEVVEAIAISATSNFRQEDQSK
jgi:excisionase family DNA binding protein